MRAARLHGHEDIRIDDVPVPVCGDGQVRIAPRFNGLCGSDLHLYYDKPMTDELANAHPVTGESLPLTLGHEFSGTVTEIGSNVTSLKLNDRVTVQPIINDSTCSACRIGAINCCRRLGFQGVHGRGGAISDALVANIESVYKLPDNVDLETGALTEPLAVGWHAVKLAGPLSLSTTTLIHGSGPIGCAVILALKAMGVQKIIVSEISPSRAALATEFGASQVINPKKTDVVEFVRDATDSEGVDLVFDCAGVPSSLAASCTAIKPLGTIVNLAIWSQPAPLNAAEMLVKEVTYKGSIAYTPDDFEEVIQALETGMLKPSTMITKKIAMDDLVKEGIETLRYTDRHCKILVDLSL